VTFSEKALKIRFGADLSQLEKDMIRSAKMSKDLGDEFKNLGKELTASVTVPLTLMGAAGIKASETIHAAMSRIRVGTGATGSDLEKLGASFKRVFGELPESAEKVSTAMADLNTRTGLTGTGLEQMATQMLELARVSGTEVAPLIQSTTRAFSSWSVETSSQSAALDVLWKVSQSTGIGVQKLSETMTVSGASLRALGLGFKEGAALVGQFEKSGLDSAAMLAGLGKGAMEMAKAGKSMGEGMRAAVQEIKDTPGAAESAAKAVKLFGESGVKMADAIKKGAFNVDDLVRAIDASPETIRKAAADVAGLSESFGTLGNKVTLALEPLGAAITKVLVDLMSIAGRFVDGVVAPLIAAFGRLPTPVQSAIVSLGMVAAAIGPMLVSFGAIVVAVAKVQTSLVALKAMWGPAVAAMSALFSGIGPIVSGAFGMVTGAFSAIAGAIVPVLSGLASAGLALLEFIGGPITLAVAAIALLVYKWDWLRESLVAAGKAILSGLGSVWDGIVSAASKAWDVIKAAVKGGIDGAIAGVKFVGTALAAAGKTVLGPYWDGMVAGLTKVGEYASAAFEGIKSAVIAAGNFIMKVLQGVLDGMGGLVGKIVDLASRAAKAVGSMFGSGGGAGISPQSGVPQLAIPGTPGGFDLGSALAGTSFGATGGSSGGASSFGAGGSSGAPKAGGAFDVGGIGSVVGPWNQTGSRQIVDPYAPPSSQGGSRDFLNNPARSASPGPALGSAGDTWGSNSGKLPTFNTEWWKGVKLAQGGLVTSPQIAMIGEAGPEAVIPLGRMSDVMGGRGRQPIVNVHVHVSGSVATQRDIAEDIRKQLVRIGQRNQTTGIV